MYLDIKGISDQFGVTPQDIALAMFPGNTFAHQALKRMVDSRKADFKLSQVFSLANYLGCHPGQLLPVEGYYKTLTEGGHTFTRGDVQITYDPENQIASVFLKDVKVYDQVMVSPALSVSAFLSEMDQHVERLYAVSVQE